MEIICENCLKTFEIEPTKRIRKYCSKVCLNKGSSYGSYKKQQERGINRKLKLIESKGGGCQHCGYNKCIGVLSFHHRDPSKKLFNLDVRSLSNRKLDIILIEADKCDLLCLNCHTELHYNEHNPY